MIESGEFALWGLRLAGAGQVVFALLHPVAARGLKISHEAARMSRLNARVFRGLFGFVTGLNLLFGLLFLLAPQLLLDGSLLARLVLGTITLYWSARLMLQVFYYPWQTAPGWYGGLPVRAGMLFAFTSFSAAGICALVVA
ncbi:MAG: hypothetical protein KF696_11810 [Planctomycetes bacterium]|nr:hypothetical protein [Planctomycetota bacterium]MCW8136974.1 hypothetical protein [Planctomycetota bacterium]